MPSTTKTTSPPPSRPAQRVKPLHDLLSHDMIDIYVGQSNTRWVLHAKLLSARSSFFSEKLYGAEKRGKTRPSAYGLPDEEEEPFRLFVAWLYGGAIPIPTEEKDVAVLLEVALMADRWSVAGLQEAVVESLREWLAREDTWPGLRRVQFIMGSTEEGSVIRKFMVACVARMVVCGDGELKAHWDKALRSNAALAFEALVCVREWGLNSENVPDPRRQSWAGEISGEVEVVGQVDANGEDHEGEEDNALALGEMANNLAIGDIGRLEP